MRVFNTTLPNGHLFKVTVQTPTDERGGCTPAFSVTAEECNPRLRRDDKIVASGLHAEILNAFPSLADVVALHLSDADGVPMHALENGLYFAAGALGGLGQRYHGSNGGSHSPEDSRRIFREMWRIDQARADSILAALGSVEHAELKQTLARFMAEEQPRWAREAEACERKYGNAK